MSDHWQHAGPTIGPPKGIMRAGMLPMTWNGLALRVGRKHPWQERSAFGAVRPVTQSQSLRRLIQFPVCACVAVRIRMLHA